MQEMLQTGFIRLSDSPWDSPVMMVVPKKDGGQRFCVDFRRLKACSIKDTHPLPCIDNLLDTSQSVTRF